MRAYEFTPTETRAIKTAWTNLFAHLDTCGHDDRHQLEAAFKGERRHLDGLSLEARAVTLKAYLEGLTDPDRAARKLAGLRASWLAAFMLGAGSRGIERDLTGELASAVAGYTAAQARFFDRARDGIAGACA